MLASIPLPLSFAIVAVPLKLFQMDGVIRQIVRNLYDQ
jgi:hypothetical protein